MKSLLVFLSIFSIVFHVSSQSNGTTEIPLWAKLMYENDTNIAYIDRLYHDYCGKNKFEKNSHYMYYKKWRRSIERYVNNDGFLDTELIPRFQTKMEEHKNNFISTQTKSGNWSPIGPWTEKKAGGVLSGRHVNISSIAICESMPNIMYCGTEPGEIYKSIDGGDNWTNVSYSVVTAYATEIVVANANIHGIAVDPLNPNKVYAVSANEIFISDDGGMNWTSNVFANAPLFGYIVTPHEIQIDPADNSRIFIAGLDGLHVSNDSGLTWTQIFSDECLDLNFRPGSPQIIYALLNNSSTNMHEFMKTTDGGNTWTSMTNGWYFSSNSSRNVIGGRLAVSPADPDVVYAFLIGNSKPGDEGFIGVYKSSNSGNSWSNVLGYDGAPYTSAHPNLIASNPLGGGFHQGMDNCGLMVSNTNPDEILVGGINLWKSIDGGLTYFNLADIYIPGLFDIHVDMQDFRSQGSTYWLSTDGGIYKSNDFFSSQPEVKMEGIQGADFWGFGAGWNFDVFGGGTFHNGVDFHMETFPQGEFFNISGGEPASGYVSPGDTNRIFWMSQSQRLPFGTTGASTDFYWLQEAPNENWWFSESSKILFHPNCYNHLYIGSDNYLMKSEDGGLNFSTVFTGSSGARILDIEISREDHHVMFAVELDASASSTRLYRTDDDWSTSSEIMLPSGGGSRLLIELDPENKDVIWLCYPRGSNGQKVFKSLDGGQSWINITSPELDDQHIYSMASVGGTDGGVYVNTNVTCYYRNNSMNAWAIDNVGLPLSITTKEIIPFYRDGKVRIGSYGKGVWESMLFEAPERPVAQIMVNQLKANCLSDLFYFDDYSMLNHSGASWYWTFENASIPNSTSRNPIVSFTSVGDHLVTLKVTNGNGVSSTDSLYVTVEIPAGISSEDFEGAFPSNDWENMSSWIKTSDAGGYGTSISSMMFDNYSINQEGDDHFIDTYLNLSNASPTDCQLFFDVAYAKFNVNYADSLEILLSTDCGLTWASLYYKGGDDLATAPDETGVAFIPSSNQWRTDSVDLSAFAGVGSLKLRFSNINDYGQRLYIDNINLSYLSNVSVPEMGEDIFELYPNPISSDGFLELKHPNNSDEFVKVSIYSSTGKLIGYNKVKEGIDLSEWNLVPGSYVVVIQSGLGIHQSKLIISGRNY